MLAKIYEQNPSEKELQRVVDALERDEIIIYPTDSVYAFGCSLRSPKAIERLRRIRGKSEEKFTVVFENIAQVAEYCRVDNAVFRILKRNLPGPFTFVLAASARIPDKALERRRTIGVRIPASPVARAVVGALGCPMITTSVKDDDQVVEYTTDPELIHERYGREVVITMDADLQDSPDEIPELRRMILEEGYDLVSGWKKKRHDPIGKRWPSKFFNWTARAASGIRLHDFNCGLKAYRRKVVKAIEVYGEMHRFIPFLAKQAGFGRIGEKVVDHRARKYGSSKFGLERTVKGYLDLITVLFMTHFGRSPMYFFGSLGTLMFLMGGGTTVWIIAEKLWKQSHALPLRAVTDQPLFYLAILAVILGVQLFLAGFLGELINRGSSERNKYLIDKTL